MLANSDAMLVERREAQEGYYFFLNKEAIQIQEEDFNYIQKLLPHLTPIQLNGLRIRQLGFTEDFRTRVCYKSYLGVTVYVRPAAGGKYILQIEGCVSKIREVNYVHQLQEFWYGNFGEILKKTGVPPRPDIHWFLLPERFSFLYDRYIFAPLDYAIYVLEECNYGLSIPYKGKNWKLQQHIGSPADKVLTDATAWLKAYLQGK